MGRKHPGRFGLRGPGIAAIFGQGIEMHQMPAGTVHEKAEKLFEYLADRLALAASPHGAEKDLQLRENIDVAKIAYEQTQTTPAGHGIGSDLDPIDDGFAFCRQRGRLAHSYLPPFGLLFVGCEGFNNLVIPRT